MKSEAPRLGFELPKGKTVNIPLPRKSPRVPRRAPARRYVLW